MIPTSRRPSVPAVLALATFLAVVLSGCGTGGIAVKQDVWEAQDEFERRQAGLSEKVLTMEGRIGALEEEVEALRFEIDRLSTQMGEMESEFSRGLESIRAGLEQMGIELEGRIRDVDQARKDDRSEQLGRLEIVLEEVTRENEALRDEIEAIRSSVAEGYEHEVKRGETLATIAAQYGVTVQGIVQANGITNPNLIAVGQKLIIPAR
jgi:nucleoid-associated protein YgaU